ncbi:phosphotransferase enzyme family protein [Sorangium cellulosum]|uniref:phosphotransferase enzyme family protein n=1 Tax=Sorangium cellulosum TaxID=56 RepID=UPI0005D217EC|nr:phosphotransferase [Sorangium cellulosum]
MIPDVWAPLRGLTVGRCDDEGLINGTWLAGLAGGGPPRFVVQRVSPIFAPEVHDDIEAVTAHLSRRGLATPRLLRAEDGALWARDGAGAVWRVMDFVPGRTHHRVGSPALARAAGALVARFHRAVDDLEHAYRHVRAGAHDTALHMERLDGAATGGEGRRLADAILDAWRTWQGRLDLPLRHCHGDLKISNLRFSEAGEGICLLDLDTLALQPIDVELGDAWRSWCNPVGEDATDARFDLEVFAAAAAGYREVRPFGGEEREALADAAERIALELAARFCRDAFEDRYFGWDPARFPTRVAHNLQRAAGQLALARSARRQRGEIARLLAGG